MQGEQLPECNVRWIDADGGASVIALAIARVDEDPLELARRLIELCPSGTHFRRLEVEREARSTRVAVTFQRLRRITFAAETVTLR
jgi:hypothetical protein